MCRWAARGRPGAVGNAGPRGRDGSFAPRARDGGRPGFAGRGCTPHSFSSCRKRMRRARWKKKTLGRKTAPLAPFLLKNGGRANPCGRNLPCFRRVRRTAQEQGTYSPHLEPWAHLSGAVDAWALLLFPRSPLRYALPRPFPGGESKGEGPQPRPFESFQGGVGETGEAPPAADEASLFRGSGAIGSPKGAGNRNAAAVLKSKRPHVSPRPKGTGLG